MPVCTYVWSCTLLCIYTGTLVCAFGSASLAVLPVPVTTIMSHTWRSYSALPGDVYFCTIRLIYETSFSLEPMTVFPHLLIIIFCVVSCFICVPCGQKSVGLYKIYILHMPVLTWETLYLHITLCTCFYIIHTFSAKTDVRIFLLEVSVLCYIVHAFSDRNVFDSWKSMVTWHWLQIVI